MLRGRHARARAARCACAMRPRFRAARWRCEGPRSGCRRGREGLGGRIEIYAHGVARRAAATPWRERGGWGGGGRLPRQLHRVRGKVDGDGGGCGPRSQQRDGDGPRAWTRAARRRSANQLDECPHLRYARKGRRAVILWDGMRAGMWWYINVGGPGPTSKKRPGVRASLR